MAADALGWIKEKIEQYIGAIKDNSQVITAIFTVVLAVATVYLANATIGLQDATERLADVSEEQKEISEQLAAMKEYKLKQRKPHLICYASTNKTHVNLQVANTGKFAVLVDQYRVTKGGVEYPLSEVAPNANERHCNNVTVEMNIYDPYFNINMSEYRATFELKNQTCTSSLGEVTVGAFAFSFPPRNIDPLILSGEKRVARISKASLMEESRYEPADIHFLGLEVHAKTNALNGGYNIRTVSCEMRHQ